MKNTAESSAREHAVNSTTWLDKDRQYMWHQITPYKASQNPLIVVEGDGAWIVDVDGNRYLDAMSGLWCVNLGYSEAELPQAAYDQLRTMPFYPLTQSHLPAITLSEKLNEWLGGEYRILFSNSGSEANEAAFKLVRQFHEQRGEGSRWKIISRYRAYHGNSLGAAAATGQAQRKIKYEPLAPGFLHVAPPYCYRCPFGQTYGSCHLECAQTYEQVINWEGPETVAAIILEPVITGGGVIVPPQSICARFGRSATSMAY